MENWYVYYPMVRADLTETLQKVRRLQDSLTAATGIRARLEERVEADRPPTWMEVYERIIDPREFSRSMEAALARSDLPINLIDARHIERFKVL